VAQSYEVTHHYRDIFGGRRLGERFVLAGEAPLDLAVRGAAVAVDPVAVVALLVREPLSVTAGGLARPGRAVRLQHATVATVERQISFARFAVVALFGAFLPAVATDCLAADPGQIADIPGFKLAVGIAPVTVFEVAIITLLVAHLDLVAADRAAASADHGTHETILEPTRAAAAVTITGVTVIAGLLAHDLLVTAHHDVQTRLALVGADPTVFDLVASGGATITALCVAVVADLVRLIDEAIATEGDHHLAGVSTAGILGAW
jgi:hypothetical protein